MATTLADAFHHAGPALLAVLSLAGACGGSSTGGSPAADGGADAHGTASGSDAASGGEAGTCRADVQHRPSAQTCPSHADSGVADAGTGGCGPAPTPSDACFSDSDCSGAHGATGDCVCQSPASESCGTPPVTGNACVPATCHVDSDCSGCGLCRVEQSCGLVTGYYCESPADQCSSNADCGSGFCTFDGDHFACQNDVACAG